MGEGLKIEKLQLPTDGDSLKLQNGGGEDEFVKQQSQAGLLSSPSFNVPTSTFSESSSISPSAKFTSKLKKFKGKPSIIDEPQLVELCEHYITTKNVTGLSLIARQRGLPPHMRHKIWPLLLKTHPFLIKPYITPDEDEEEDQAEIKDKIKHDLKKYFKRSRNHIDVNEKRSTKEPSPEIQELLKIEDEIIKVMQYSITKFLKKWGSLINYNSGLTWIALGLAEWVPPLTSVEESSSYVLCGREHVNRNGETCLKNIDEELNEYLNYSNYVSEDLIFSTRNGSPSSMSSILHNFTKKQVDTATDDSSSTVSDSTFTTTTSTLPIKPSVASSVSGSNNNKNLSFAEIYERMVLVILHSPEPSEDSSSSHTNDEGLSDGEEETLKEKILTTLPVKGGTAEERLSFFLYCLRRLLPELAQFFTDEDILNTTSVKDDWVVWWLKWCGAKVWSKYDRGRIWDMLLGWRSFDEFANPEELNDLLLDDGISNLLGPDIYWHPLTFENQKNIDDDDEEEDEEDNSVKGHDRRSSLKSLISSFSTTNLTDNSTSLNTDVVRAKIPFSNLDPHTEIVFISLSFIKSKEFALLELEQSEIREFLSKASSTKLDGFQNLFEDEINVNDNNELKNGGGGNGANDQFDDQIEDSNGDLRLEEYNKGNKNNNNSNNRRLQKNGLRDIENIIMESGELWRKWVWQEVVD